MRTFAVRNFGERPTLLDLAPPSPDVDRDILVRVAVAGVNPVDYKRVDWLTADAIFPYVLGVDFAGTIERVPPGDHGFAIGDRVFGMARRTGAYAAFTLVSQAAPGEAFARIPDGISFEQAAVLPVAGVTALGSLELLALSPGNILVVLGASGAVGGYAVPLARARGVHVIGTTRGQDGEARRLGAHQVFDTTSSDPLVAIGTAYPDGVDAVLDLISDKAGINRVAKLIRRGGCLVSTQRAANESALAERGIAAYNIAAPENPKATREGLEELATALATGLIEARITFRTDLSRSGDALERVRQGGLPGKAVVLVS